MKVKQKLARSTSSSGVFKWRRSEEVAAVRFSPVQPGSAQLMESLSRRAGPSPPVAGRQRHALVRHAAVERGRRGGLLPGSVSTQLGQQGAEGKPASHRVWVQNRGGSPAEWTQNQQKGKLSVKTGKRFYRQYLFVFTEPQLWF